MFVGLTAEGVQVQTLEEILADLEADARSTIHPQLDCSETSPHGQQFGIWAEREVNLQQALRAVANSFSPKASGRALANVSLLTGTVKDGATKSQVGATVNLNAGFTLPAGSRANVDGDTTAVFETIADVTNGSGIAADVAVTMQAVTAGPVRAASGTLTIINTPLSGWNSVTNAFDADVGLDIESDPALRVRREEELRIQGSTVVSAIVADVEGVEGTTKVIGFENQTGTDGVNNLVAHSFEIVVWDGVSPAASDNLIAQAIFNAKPSGIGPVTSGLGTDESGTAVSTEGDEYTVAFSRALQKTLYITYTLDTDDSYPVDGDAQVQAAVVAELDGYLTIGVDVIRTKLFKPAYTVQGVLDVVDVTLGFLVAPAGTSNLAVGTREIAVADTARIVVNS